MMKNKFIDTALNFKHRNIDRVIRYRLRSFFNLSNSRFDYFFAKNLFLKRIYKFFMSVFLFFRYLLNKKASIPQLDFIITTNCTLNCENCATLIPYYEKSKRYNITFDEFKSDLDKLLSVVDKIYRLKLIGGEPLLVSHLDKMLEYACEQKQIVSVEITTNGTIIPSDEICCILKKYSDKALVFLSDYTQNKQLLGIKFEQIKSKLEEYEIYTILSRYDWFLVGKMQESKKSQEELVQIFENCWQKDCAAFAKGIFYNCTRAIAVNKLTDFYIPDDEAINIREGNLHFLLRKINNFYSKNHFSVCNFCQQSYDNKQKRAIQGESLQKIGRLSELE